MSHILVDDVGSSRMNWALVGVHGYLARGVVPNAEIGTLALRDWQNLPRPARVLGVNVAREAARVRLEADSESRSRCATTCRGRAATLR